MYSTTKITSVLSWTLGLLIVQIAQQVSNGQFIEPAYVEGQTLELDHRSTMDALNIGYIARMAQENNLTKYLNAHHRGVYRSLADFDQADGGGSGKADLPQDCGKASSKRSMNKIAGGYPAKQGEYPSYVKLIVFLKSIPGETILCGGVIVNSRYVFTAGHCLEDVARIEISPTLKRQATGKSYSAKRWCLSPKYQIGGEGLQYDFAVIKISGEFKFDNNIQPACVPKSAIGDRQQGYNVGLGAIDQVYGPFGPISTTFADTLQVLPVLKERCPLFERASYRICFRSNNPSYRGDSCPGKRRS